MSSSLLRNRRRLAKKLAQRNNAHAHRGIPMSDQVQEVAQPTAEQQQLAHIQALATKQVESLLDATNAVRDIPKIFAANQSLAAERNALAAKAKELEAKVDGLQSHIASLEERLANLAPKAVEE